MSPEWGRKIKGKSPNAQQVEITGSYLAAPGETTDPVGEQVFDQFVRGVGRTGSSAGGGRAMSGQGTIASIQEGWPKVQPPTAQQFEDEPRLRNASGLNKMNLFKMFGLKKHWPTTQEWKQHQQGLSDVEAEQDATRDFASDVDPRFQHDSEIKPYLTMDEARKQGILTDQSPDPEPGTEVQNKYERVRGIYPDKGQLLRRKGDYTLPRLGEFPMDYADPNEEPRRGE